MQGEQAKALQQQVVRVEAPLVAPVDHRLARAAEAIDTGTTGYADEKRDDKDPMDRCTGPGRAKEKGRTLERGPSDSKSGRDQKRMPMFAATALFFWFERPTSWV